MRVGGVEQHELETSLNDLERMLTGEHQLGVDGDFMAQKWAADFR